MWIDAREDAEDVAASDAAVSEYAEATGIDADSYFRRLVAEGRVGYEVKSKR
jgi:hypothetical protein